MSIFRQPKFPRFAAAILFFIALPALHAQAPPANSPDASFNTYARLANEARDSGNADAALQNYTEALKLDPTWQEGWWSVGSLEYERDHYAAAIPAFRTLAALAPQASPAWTFLGLCEFETKDYPAALEHLAKGDQLGGIDDPEIARVAKFHLALLQIRSGDFAQANALLLPLATHGEVSPQIKSALGLALLRVPLLPSEVDPSHEAMLQDLGSIAILNADDDSAATLAAFNSAIQKYPDAPHLHDAYAEALLQQGNLTEALTQLRRESAISPASPLPQIAIARAELRNKNPQSAVQAAQQAVNLAPASREAREVLAESYAAAGNRPQAAAASAAAQKLSPDQSPTEPQIVAYYQTHSSAQPNTAQTNAPAGDDLWNNAMRDYAAEKYPEAIAALKIWLRQNPDSGTAWAVLGLSEFAQNDHANALIHLQRGQQLGLRGSPESVQLAKYRLATLLNNTAQFDAAEQLLMSIADPGDRAPAIHFALGMSLLRLNAFPDQVPASQQPLVAAAGEVAALLKDSRYDRAFSQLDALLKKYPDAPFLHYTYGTALAALSQFDEAAKQFREETRLSPSSELPYLGIASLEIKRRRPADALEPARRAVQLAPRNATAHYLLGRTYLESGNDAAAITELQTAADLAPGSPEVHFNLAKAYAKSNQPAKAAAERATFAQLNAAAEAQRSHQGTQSYGTAHEATEPPISTIDRATPTTPNPN